MRLMLQSLLEERFALKLHDASDTDAALLVVDSAQPPAANWAVTL
jgi:hypothetical protein